MNENDLKEIERMLKYHLGIFQEKINRKLDILIEGIQILNSKLDRLLKEWQELVIEGDRIERV